MKSSKYQNDFVFVVGCPRSGTYLLSTLLNHHFSIGIPIETHFIPIFKRYLFLWGDLKQYKNRKRLLRCIFEFLEIWTLIESTNRNYEKEWHYSLLIVKENWEEILLQTKSYKQIVKSLFHEYAKKKGYQRYGDKSAFADSMPLVLLKDSVDTLKVIHIVRDGRDVSLSWRRLWIGPKTVSKTAFAWRRHIVEKRRWGKKNSPNYLEIKYEDLLDYTNVCIKTISEFLSIPISNENVSITESSFARLLGAGNTHPLLGGTIKKHNKHIWKKQMNTCDRHLFETIAGKTLKECGYNKNLQKSNILKKTFLFIRIALDMLRECLSSRNFKYIVKTNLPLLLFVLDIFHIKLSKHFYSFHVK